MKYNINFCLLSTAYLLITTIFYIRQRRVISGRSRLFAAMLIFGLLSLLLDILAAVADPYAYLWPVWSIYIVNIIFLLCTQVSGILFFAYGASLTGANKGMSRRRCLLLCLPFVLAAALLLSSPFSPYGVFYLDANNVYYHGATHFVLYLTSGFYLVGCFVLLLYHRRRLQRLKFYTIFVFLAVILLVTLIQIIFPRLLLNSSATAFALVLIYYVLEAPGTHADPLTGVLNRTALPLMLSDAFEERERCSLLVYALGSMNLGSHFFVIKDGDRLLTAFARSLQHSYPKQAVIRLEGNVFCVLLRGGSYIDAERLERLYADTRGNFTVTSEQITLHTCLACINSDDCADAQEMSALLEGLLARHRNAWPDGTLPVDRAFKTRLERSEAVEKATLRALEEGRVEIFYQPIHDGADGHLCALEALARISDPELGLLPTQELMELAERNGSILPLGELVLRKTCAFLSAHNAQSWGLDHVGVNLSAVQCVASGLPDLVGRILQEYNIPEGFVALELTETAAGTLAVVRENMERLSSKGVYFLLDDFGTGFANFRNLTALPCRCVKLDKSLLFAAQESTAKMHLLSGVVNVVHTLGLSCLCEGVETAEQVELLRGLGVSMLQGYYFSKPLSSEALLDYVEKAGVC